MYGVDFAICVRKPDTKNAFVTLEVPNDPLNSMQFDKPEELSNFIGQCVLRGCKAFGQVEMLQAVDLVLGMAYQTTGLSSAAKVETPAITG